MGPFYSETELKALGFESIGTNVMVSQDARFFVIKGSLGDNVRIDAFAFVSGHIELGNGVHICPFCFLGGTGGMIKMEDGSGLASHVSVITKSAAGYTKYELNGQDKVEGNVVIGKRSIIGSGSKIMPGTSIGEDVSVGCNCVVNRDLPKGAMIVSRSLGLVTVSNRAE